MNKIDEKINALKKSNKFGFMGHFIAGFPDIPTSIKAAKGICRAGIEFLEVQFPFSDPTADGPTIEGACYKSLENGFTVAKGFEIARELASTTDTAIIVMTYANIVFRYGTNLFISKVKEVGASGIIIADMPPEYDEGIIELCKQNDLRIILICAPGASSERIRQLSEKGSGFLYTAMRRGITGRKTDISEETAEWLKKVRSNSILPIAAAFGIRSKEQIDLLRDMSDIAVCGSYFVKKIEEAVQNGLDVEETLYKTVKELIG
ncbi:MAG TPA: tryptophan synthase subunit alpha [Spirochaetota bacterium]|jgi:tryptophan synthase alpha chain|nr:MAG: Tryptophan synthase alpha chain [Spirochaetes bacterium ADurb.Bin133]HNZ27103.1 tryptophan synthase subunit alpha [Spirochaetota bacterium]HOF01883.1 tryptophan synthase subunit alpha [Spirochaetota bacterium]HOS33663.1 tryptophan synthase subunit alpha [Spirochaetota bacterium]HOS56753.1 tryptophan synthase subunit alpha [Spirochaetota bacterium]